MNFTIRGKPQFEFELTRERIDLLLLMSELHYDGLCKSLGRPGRGAFVWGWHVHCDSSPSAQVVATWRELDLCLKLLEAAPSDRFAEARVLAAAIRRAMSDSRPISEAWVAELPGVA